MEYSIDSGYFEFSRSVSVTRGEAIRVIECYRDLVVSIGRGMVGRSTVDDVLAIVFSERETGEAMVDGLFVARVDIGGIPDIEGEGLAGVRERKRLRLGFAEEGPFGAVGVATGAPIGELHPVEREVGVLELGAPGIDHAGEDFAVGFGLVGVGLALIPDGAAEGVGGEGGDHGVVEHQCMVFGAGSPRRVGLLVLLGPASHVATFSWSAATRLAMPREATAWWEVEAARSERSS